MFLLLICFGCWLLVSFRTCIKGRSHHVHAFYHIQVVSVHARCLMNCLLGIFSLVWTLMSTNLQGFSCFLIRNMFGLLVVYLTHLAPHVHFSCIAHSHLMHTPLLPLPCLGLYLVSSSLACHVYFILCSIVFLSCFVFCLTFIFSFIL